MEIHSVKWMYDNGQSILIKEKVKNNHYLSSFDPCLNELIKDDKIFAKKFIQNYQEEIILGLRNKNPNYSVIWMSGEFLQLLLEQPVFSNVVLANEGFLLTLLSNDNSEAAIMFYKYHQPLSSCFSFNLLPLRSSLIRFMLALDSKDTALKLFENQLNKTAFSKDFQFDDIVFLQESKEVDLLSKSTERIVDIYRQKCFLYELMKVSGFLDDQFDILLQKQSNNKEDENNNNSKESKIKFLVSSVQSKKYVTPLDTLRLTKDDLKSTLKHVSGDNRRVKAVWDVILDKDYFDSDVYLYYFAKFKDGRFLKNVFHTKDQLLFPYYYLDIDLLAEYLNNSKPFSLHPIADFPKEIIKTKTEAEVNAFFTLLLENYHVYWSHYDQLLIVFIQVFRYLDVAIVRHVYQTIERLSLFREGFLPIPLSFYEFKERPLEVLEFLQSTGRFNIQFGDIEAMSYNQLLFCLNKGMVTLTAMSAGFPHIKKVVEMYTQKQFDKLREYAYRYLNVGSNMKQFDPCIPLQSIEVDELFHIGMQGSIKVIDCFMRLHFPTEKETTKRLEYLSQLLNGVLVGRHMNILEHLHKYYDHVFITQPNNEYRKDCPFFPQKVISLFLYEVKRIPRMFVFLKELTTKIE